MTNKCSNKVRRRPNRLGWLAALAATNQLAIGPIRLSQADGPAAGLARSKDPTTQTAASDNSLVGPLSAVATALARGELVVARYLITPNHLRGDIAEAVVNGELLRRAGESGGDWRMIRPRSGSQGLDGVLIKLDSSGRPRQLLVAEVKFNTSDLGTTRDGVQMSSRWRGRHLAALSKRYTTFGQEWSAGHVRVVSASRGLPSALSPHETLDIPMSGGRVMRAWRSADGSWNLHPGHSGDVGRREVLGVLDIEVSAQLRHLSEYLDKAAAGLIGYESHLYSLTPAEGALHVTVRDCGLLDHGASRVAQLPVIARFNISDSVSNASGWAGRVAPTIYEPVAPFERVVKQEVARTLLRRLPHLSEAEALYLSQGVLTHGTTPWLSRSRGHFLAGMGSSLAAGAVTAGLFGAVLDPVLGTGMDWVHEGRLRFDPGWMARSAGLAFTSTTIGVASGQGTVAWATRNPLFNQFARKAAGVLGLPATSIFSSAVGEAVGGGVASVAYSLMGYQLGWMDASAARRNALVGVAATTASVAAYTGGLALVSAYGTASTGVAISSLSGAAATSASLAWLGGGSAAAGGGGMALGSIVATGGAAVIAIGLGGAVAYGFHYYDQANEVSRIKLTIQDLKNCPDYSRDSYPWWLLFVPKISVE